MVEDFLNNTREELSQYNKGEGEGNNLVDSSAILAVESPADHRLTYTELIYGTLFRPTDTFRKVALEKPVFKSFILFSGAIILNLLANIILTPHLLAQNGLPASMNEAIAGALPFLTIIGAVFAYISWVWAAGLLHFFAEFFDGRGSVLGMFSILGLVELPRMAALPLQVVGTVTNSAFIATFFSLLSTFFYFIWWSVLVVIGVREAYALTVGKAISVIAVPIFFLIFALIIITIAGFGAMVPLLKIMSISG